MGVRRRTSAAPCVALWVALWAGALAATAGLALWRYDGAAGTAVGTDFATYFRAAVHVAHGQNPYSGVSGYVYPPTLALALATFAHDRPETVWRVWLALIVVVPLGGVAAFGWMQRRRVHPLVLPPLVAFCSLTLLWPRFWPVSRDLSLGQTDTMVLPFVVLAALMADRSRNVLRGAALGLAALLKGWPLAIGLSLLQTRTGRSRGALATVVLVASVGPLLALGLFGTGGVRALIGNVYDARRQPELVNDCVWGVPRLVFSTNGLARPLVVSTPLRTGFTLLLAGWVVALLVTALRTKGDPAACTFNVTFCVVLLMPISHRQYAVLALPLLWCSAARLLRPSLRPRHLPGLRAGRQAGLLPGLRRRADWLVFAVLAAWWVVQSTAWPYTFSSHNISSIRYSVPFAADLLACTASVYGSWLRRDRDETAPALSPATRPATQPEPIEDPGLELVGSPR